MTDSQAETNNLFFLKKKRLLAVLAGCLSLILLLFIPAIQHMLLIATLRISLSRHDISANKIEIDGPLLSIEEIDFSNKLLSGRIDSLFIPLETAKKALFSNNPFEALSGARLSDLSAELPGGRALDIRELAVEKMPDDTDHLNAHIRLEDELIDLTLTRFPSIGDGKEDRITGAIQTPFSRLHLDLNRTQAGLYHGAFYGNIHHPDAFKTWLSLTHPLIDDLPDKQIHLAGGLQLEDGKWLIEDLSLNQAEKKIQGRIAITKNGTDTAAISAELAAPPFRLDGTKGTALSRILDTPPFSGRIDISTDRIDLGPDASFALSQPTLTFLAPRTGGKNVLSVSAVSLEKDTRTIVDLPQITFHPQNNKGMRKATLSFSAKNQAVKGTLTLTEDRGISANTLPAMQGELSTESDLLTFALTPATGDKPAAVTLHAESADLPHLIDSATGFSLPTPEGKLADLKADATLTYEQDGVTIETAKLSFDQVDLSLSGSYRKEDVHLSVSAGDIDLTPYVMPFMALSLPERESWLNKHLPNLPARHASFRLETGRLLLGSKLFEKTQLSAALSPRGLLTWDALLSPAATEEWRLSGHLDNSIRPLGLFSALSFHRVDIGDFLHNVSGHMPLDGILQGEATITADGDSLADFIENKTIDADITLRAPFIPALQTPHLPAVMQDWPGTIAHEDGLLALSFHHEKNSMKAKASLSRNGYALLEATGERENEKLTGGISLPGRDRIVIKAALDEAGYEANISLPHLPLSFLFGSAPEIEDIDVAGELVLSNKKDSPFAKAHLSTLPLPGIEAPLIISASFTDPQMSGFHAKAATEKRPLFTLSGNRKGSLLTAKIESDNIRVPETEERPPAFSGTAAFAGTVRYDMKKRETALSLKGTRFFVKQKNEDGRQTALTKPAVTAAFIGPRLKSLTGKLSLNEHPIEWQIKRTGNDDLKTSFSLLKPAGFKKLSPLLSDFILTPKQQNLLRWNKQSGKITQLALSYSCDTLQECFLPPKQTGFSGKIVAAPFYLSVQEKQNPLPMKQAKLTLSGQQASLDLLAEKKGTSFDKFIEGRLLISGFTEEKPTVTATLSGTLPHHYLPTKMMPLPLEKGRFDFFTNFSGTISETFPLSGTFRIENGRFKPYEQAERQLSAQGRISKDAQKTRIQLAKMAFGTDGQPHNLKGTLLKKDKNWQLNLTGRLAHKTDTLTGKLTPPYLTLKNGDLRTEITLSGNPFEKMTGRFDLTDKGLEARQTYTGAILKRPTEKMRLTGTFIWKPHHRYFSVMPKRLQLGKNLFSIDGQSTEGKYSRTDDLMLTFNGAALISRTNWPLSIDPKAPFSLRIERNENIHAFRLSHLADDKKTDRTSLDISCSLTDSNRPCDMALTGAFPALAAKTTGASSAFRGTALLQQLQQLADSDLWADTGQLQIDLTALRKEKGKPRKLTGHWAWQKDESGGNAILTMADRTRIALQASHAETRPSPLSLTIAGEDSELGLIAPLLPAHPALTGKGKIDLKIDGNFRQKNPTFTGTAGMDLPTARPAQTGLIRSLANCSASSDIKNRPELTYRSIFTQNETLLPMVRLAGEAPSLTADMTIMPDGTIGDGLLTLQNGYYHQKSKQFRLKGNILGAECPLAP